MSDNDRTELERLAIEVSGELDLELLPNILRGKLEEMAAAPTREGRLWARIPRNLLARLERAMARQASALASERAKRVEAVLSERMEWNPLVGQSEARAQAAERRASVSEATIAEVREWERKPWGPDLGGDCAELAAIVRGASTAAFDRAIIKARAGALREAANVVARMEQFEQELVDPVGFLNGRADQEETKMTNGEPA